MTVTAVRSFLVEGAKSADGWTGVKAFLFVKIETEGGIDGWGEAYVLDGRERAIRELVTWLGAPLVGQDSPSPRAFRSIALELAAKRTGIDFFCALSALEMALWDLTGKQLGVPLHQLLGGALHDRIPLYANTWSGYSPSIDQIVARAGLMKQQGYVAIKIYPMQFPTLAEAEDCVRRVRAEIGPDMDLMIDLNVLDDPHRAISAGRRFASYAPFWFEEPVSSDDLETLAQVRAQVGLRTVSGERHGGKQRFREMLERRAADVLNPDIAGCGGILELLEVAAMAEAFSVAVTPHSYNSLTLAMAAMLQVSAVIPNLLSAEYYPAFAALSDQLAQVDFRIEQGSATLPRTPGLGVTMNEQALAALSV